MALLDQDASSILMATTVSLTLFYFAFNEWRERRKMKKPFDDLPVAPNRHWLFGHVKLILEDFPHGYYSVMRDHANAEGRTGYWMGPSKGAMSVRRVEDARLLLHRESNRNNIPIVSRYVNHVIGDKNLLSLNGREWKLHRDAVTRTFVPSFLLQAQKDVLQVSDDLVQTAFKKIDQQNGQKYWQVDVQPIMKMVTMDVIGKAAFSTDFDCCKSLKPSPIVRAFEDLTEDLTERMKSPVHPLNYCFSIPTERNKQHRKQYAVLRDFIQELLSKAQRETTTTHKGSDSGSGSNLLTRLVEAHGENSALREEYQDNKLSEVLKDVMSTLLFASYDTTSTTLTYALYLLAKHPEIQEACVEEVVRNSNNNMPNAEELVYCTAVIKETLRLYPPAFQISRTLTKPLQLPDGYNISSGTHVNVPVWIIQRDEAIFPKPEECLPERWAERATLEGPKAKWKHRTFKDGELPAELDGEIPAGNPDAILAFSAGGRSCPGAKFALQEAVLVLGSLVKHLKFSPVPGYQLKLKLQGILPYPADGMPLRVERRHAPE